MKDLYIYLKESLDEENLIWKIETYFDKKPEHYKQFTNIVNKFKDNTPVTVDALSEYLKDISFKIKPFIDFLDDDIRHDDSVNKDYVYLFKKTIEIILGRKDVEM